MTDNTDKTDNEKDANTLTLPLRQMLVTRENMVIPTAVFEHEIPILEKIHGQDMVQEGDDSELEEEESDVATDAATEFLRLQSKYNTPREPGIVESVYSGPEDLAAKTDFTAPQKGDRKAKLPPKATVINHAKDAKKAAKKAAAKKAAR